MRIKIITIAFLALAGLFPAAVSGAESPMAAADSAYAAKDYARAVMEYQALEETEGTSVALLYNLGNAYFQEGDFGHAMLCWQRARRLDPSNSEVNANIRYLTGRVEDSNKAELKGRRMKVTPDEKSFFGNIHASVAENVSSDTWAVWGAVFFILFIGGTALYIFSRSVAARKTGFFGGIVSLLLAVVFVAFAAMGARVMNAHDTGVVTGFKVMLRTEPGDAGNPEKAGILTKGTVVQILSEEVDAEGNVTWYKVRLNSDYIGWIPVSDMEIV